MSSKAVDTMIHDTPALDRVEDRDEVHVTVAGRNIGYYFRDTHRAFRRIMKAQIKPFGVTVAMWTLLWELWQQDGLTQNEIARRVKLEKPSVGAILQQMEKRGLVERRVNPDDKRSRPVYLTPRAQELREGMFAMLVGVNEAVLSELSPDEIAQLMNLLARVNKVAGEVADRVDAEGLDDLT